jgi:hypothetical protein
MNKRRPPLLDEEPRQDALSLIEQALRGLRFGYVTVIVQDGVVIQIERTEKTRLHKGVSS